MRTTRKKQQAKLLTKTKLNTIAGLQVQCVHATLWIVPIVPPDCPWGLRFYLTIGSKEYSQLVLLLYRLLHMHMLSVLHVD